MKGRKWTNNIGLKIGSLVFAAVMWTVVTNLNDPLDTRTYDNVPVRILNGHIIEDSNRVFAVLENTDVIDRVTVRAPRSVISMITHANIVAQADINFISSLDTVAITLGVNNFTAAEISDIDGSSTILKLSIEDKRERRFPIRAMTEGTITEGYLQGDISIDPNSININGPESIINSISYAAARVDITGFVSDISTTAPVYLYDVEGNRVVSDRINQDISNTSFRVPILETKTIPISYSVSGNPPQGFRRNGIQSISHSEILIAGSSNAIRNINEIIISPERVDISDSTELFVAEIDINAYLPHGVRLVDMSDHIVMITVGVEAEVSRNISLPEERLRILNMPSGFQASFLDFTETSPFILVGLRRDLNLIEEEEVYGDIDIAAWMGSRGINQLTQGYYELPVTINMGNDINVANVVTVWMNISPIGGY
ncbi:MAG: hypothetical protein LBC96_00910 [Lachnospiraceae bacterium]|jgi:YbbR domain-containing protein|nr:hypothetical protein [Lachnospiraceae bacterium]